VALAKKREKDLEAHRDISSDVLEEEFVPYSCHYNPHTILTKNGEVLQTIKITGFAYEALDSDYVSLRDAIRTAILHHIQTTDYAIWLHTIRRKKSLKSEGIYPNDFSGFLHHSWNQRNDWEHKYTNEVYITIVREGQAANKPLDFLRGCIGPLEQKYRWGYIEKAEQELSAVVGGMLSELKKFGARKLGVQKRGGIYYSEMAQFFSKLINLTDVPTPLPDISLATYLTDHDVTFGYNAMEVRGKDKAARRRFAALLTVKEYKELSTAAIDAFLQAPAEFIVTQCIDFINRDKALAEFEYQKEILEISGATKLSELSGLTDIMESDEGKPTDFGEQQLSIFVLGDSIQEMEKEVVTLTNALKRLGILSIREDIFLEEGYWSILPANFPFLRRLRPINTKRLGGFANLSNFPAGIAENNHWGPAVTTLLTAARTPYFFNFHAGNNGHTIIVGPYGAGKTVLLNFLLSEARKFGSRLFFFDHNRGSEIFLRAIGGAYHRLSPAPSKVAMNPFHLPDSPDNRFFLQKWAETLLFSDSSHVTPAAQNILRTAVTRLFEFAPAERHMRNFVELIESMDSGFSSALRQWVDVGAFASLFDHQEENLNLNNPIAGFEMAELTENKACLIPVLSYLLHKINLMLDGTPTILVLDEAWKLLDTPQFSGMLKDWMEHLRTHNAMAILATENIKEAGQSAISPIIMQHIATQIYLPDTEMHPSYQEVFYLTEKECMFLSMMENEERHFLLKRGHETIVVSLDLSGMDKVIAVLSANEDSLKRMDTAIAELGDEPMRWLPRMHALKGKNEP